ncbi:MAG: sigma 54-interacting transcriptional regulator [Candidatus Thiodiazotropha sp. DIVDIV]
MSDWKRRKIKILEGGIDEMVDQIEYRQSWAVFPNTLRLILIDDTYGVSMEQVERYLDQYLTNENGKPYVGSEWEVSVFATSNFKRGEQLLERLPQLDIDGVLLDLMDDATRALPGKAFDVIVRNSEFEPRAGVMWISQVANGDEGKEIQDLAANYGHCFAVNKTDYSQREKAVHQQIEKYFGHVTSRARHAQEPWAKEYGLLIGTEMRAQVSCFIDLLHGKDPEKTMPIVLLGESGTGKELVARLVHSLDRVRNPSSAWLNNLHWRIQQWELAKQEAERNHDQPPPYPTPESVDLKELLEWKNRHVGWQKRARQANRDGKLFSEEEPVIAANDLGDLSRADWFENYKVLLTAGTSPELLPSVLFGHVKGAYTDAYSSRPGLIKLAEGGTLFIDELADVSVPAQTGLLRYLQEGEVLPQGSDHPIFPKDIRKIFATHSEPLELTRSEKMRADFLNRIDGLTLRLKSLKERSEQDHYELVEHFIRTSEYRTREGSLPVKEAIAEPVRERIVDLCGKGAFEWNVRQLQRFVHRMMFVTETGKAAGENEYQEACKYSLIKPGTKIFAVQEPSSLEDVFGELGWNEFNAADKNTRIEKMKQAVTLGAKPKEVVTYLVDNHLNDGEEFGSLNNARGKPIFSDLEKFDKNKVIQELTKLYSKNKSTWLK